MKLDSRHILILLGLTSALSSCVQFSAQEGMAQLYPPVFEVDATVEDLAQTKVAPDAPAPDEPALSDIHFTVKDKDGNVVYELEVWEAPLKLPIGDYSIEAYSGSNAFGSPYFKGTTSVTVAGGKEETPKITMKLQNAYLAVGLTETLAKHFKTSGNCIRISTESASIDTGLDTYVFVPSDQQLSIAISGSSSADIAKTITHSLTARTAATATYLSCDLTKTNAPTIKLNGTPEAWGTVGYIPVATTENISEKNVAEMKYWASSNNWTKSVEGTIVDIDGKKLVKFTGLTPGATYKVRAQIGALNSNEVSMTMSTSALSIKTAAAHTYTKNELDGTDFTASFSVAEKFGVTESSLQLCKTDGTVLTVLRKVDHLTGTSAEWTSDGSDLTGPSDWPYLPQGNYILKGTASQNGVEVHLEEKSITVDDEPTFTVNTPSAHTSYNTYLSSGATAANNEDGSTIYGITNNGVKISNNILQNANYSSLIGGYTYFIDEKQVYEVNQANQTWAPHEIKAKYTFDGVTAASAPLTCNVTGLPYKSQTPTQTNWTGNAGKWESSQVILSNQTIQIKFYTPIDCNIKIDYKLRIDRNTLGNTFYIYSNTSEVYKNAPAYNCLLYTSPSPRD